MVEGTTEGSPVPASGALSESPTSVASKPANDARVALVSTGAHVGDRVRSLLACLGAIQTRSSIRWCFTVVGDPQSRLPELAADHGFEFVGWSSAAADLGLVLGDSVRGLSVLHALGDHAAVACARAARGLPASVI
ncbi:MAG: hypothetical protein KDC38_05040, partial [Planctomycetes bacterium]|nr:hypothetical protein [Planctomycetota bacterium]